MHYTLHTHHELTNIQLQHIIHHKHIYSISPLCTHTLTHVHTHTLTHVHKHTHTHTLAKHTQVHSHMCTHTSALTHILHVHVHTHAHTHIYLDQTEYFVRRIIKYEQRSLWWRFATVRQTFLKLLLCAASLKYLFLVSMRIHQV